MIDILKELSLSYYLTLVISVIWVIDHMIQVKKINSLKGDINELRRSK